MQGGEGERLSSATATKSRETMASSDDPNAYLGQLFGRFRAQSRLADEFGFHVLLATHQRTNREAAIKILVPTLARERDRVPKFVEAARAAGTSGHPNLVEVIEVGALSDGVPFLVTELVKGKTLETLIRTKGPMAVERALWVAERIASALVAMHAQGIAHGALSPNDVTVTGDGGSGERVKVAEFGMAHFDIVKNVLADPEGPFARTLEYMAPEQIDDPSKVDPVGVDIYSFGALMYAMLGGVSPFAKLETGDLLPAVVEQEPRKLRELRPDLRVSVGKIVNRAMRKARDQRYATMQEVHDALLALDMAPVSARHPPAGVGGSPASADSGPRAVAGAAPANVAASPTATPVVVPVPASSPAVVPATAAPTATPVVAVVAPAAAAAVAAAPVAAVAVAPPAAEPPLAEASLTTTTPAVEAVNPFARTQVAASEIEPAKPAVAPVERRVVQATPGPEVAKKRSPIVWVAPLAIALAAAGAVMMRGSSRDEPAPPATSAAPRLSALEPTPAAKLEPKPTEVKADPPKSDTTTKVDTTETTSAERDVKRVDANRRPAPLAPKAPLATPPPPLAAAPAPKPGPQLPVQAAPRPAAPPPALGAPIAPPSAAGNPDIPKKKRSSADLEPY